MSKSIVKIAPDINIYLTNVITIQKKPRYSQILIIAKTLKALDLLLKKCLLGIVTKKHLRGATIHEIKESFPLKPSLKTKYLLVQSLFNADIFFSKSTYSLWSLAYQYHILMLSTLSTMYESFVHSLKNNNKIFFWSFNQIWKTWTELFYCVQEREDFSGKRSKPLCLWSHFRSLHFSVTKGEA